MKYADLPDSGTSSMTCINPECEHFHILYSGHRGDYFMHPRDAEIRCVCGELMYLATEQRVLVIEGEEL